MSGSHEKLPGLFWVQLVAAAIVGILWLFSPGEGGHGEAEAKVDPTMADALKPIGSVALAKPVAEAGAARAGDAIVAKNCQVCHSIGLANAPKLDAGAKADWEARLAGDLDALVASAIKGKGGMPPRGGDPSLSDDEIASAIQHMLSGVGIEVAEAAEAVPVKVEEVAKVEAAAKVEPAVEKTLKAEPVDKVEEVVKAESVDKVEEVVKAEPAKTVAKVAAVVVAKPAELVITKLGESTYKSSCFACHDSGVANSPKFGDKSVWAPRIATGISALHSAAIKGKGAMPSKGGNPSLSDQAVMEAVNFMVINSQ